MYSKDFKEKIDSLINSLDKDEEESITKASLLMFKAMKAGLLVHVFATGHSHMFAEELFYRACGLAPINPILVPILMQHEGAVRSTKLERTKGLAQIIYNLLDLKDDEPFIIVSNSGINNVPIEMAKICKENKHPVIVITSLKSSMNLESRNEAGLHLYDLASVVIDNHAPMGDGALDSRYGKLGSTSTILNSFIAQKIVLKVIELYEKEGLTPPIYMSANVPGGDEHNKALYEKYGKRIKALY